MQNVQELEDKIFFELKNALDNLARISSKEELLTKHELFAEITDRLAFLRILEKNREYLAAPDKTEESDLGNFSAENSERAIIESFDVEEPIEEEVIYTSEINELPLAENEISATVVGSEIVESQAINPESVTANDHQELSEETELTYEERVAAKEKELQDLEERRRKIVDFTKEQVQHKPEQVFHDSPQTAQPHVEKKFKLASIKGLKAVQNLFDEDPLENAQPETTKPEADEITGSLRKSNIPTEYMEAPKKQPEFKIDFNDKIAFTKLLFGGSEEELRATIAHLNTFEKLDDAKLYLSELYYKKDWGKVDEYAQRLWELVESKFL